MAWTKINHDCSATWPKPGEIERAGIRPGSVWQCDQSACGKRYEYVGLDTHGYPTFESDEPVFRAPKRGD